MIADGLWRAKARREVRAHQSRPRRECLGDLVQIDGSPHAWFEDRGPACVLIEYVDDAAAGDGVLRRGDDRGVHGDDAGAFGDPRPAGGVLLGPPQRVPVNKKDKGDELTQFSRVLRTLDIAAIHARGPPPRGASNERTKCIRTG